MLAVLLLISSCGLHRFQLVAVYCNEGTQPAIAKITAIDDNHINVIWLKGSYTTAWEPYILYEGRRRVDWKDNLAKSSILLYDFELTKTKHLRKVTIEHLKKAYQQLHVDNN